MGLARGWNRTRKVEMSLSASERGRARPLGLISVFSPLALFEVRQPRALRGPTFKPRSFVARIERGDCRFVTRHEALRCSDCIGLMYDLIETKAGVGSITSVVRTTGSSYWMFVRGSSPTFATGRCNLHEHHNFPFLSPGGDPSRLIDLSDLTASP